MKVRKPFRTGKTIRDVYQNKLEKRTKSYYEKSVFSRKKTLKMLYINISGNCSRQLNYTIVFWVNGGKYFANFAEPIFLIWLGNQ